MVISIICAHHAQNLLQSIASLFALDLHRPIVKDVTLLPAYSSLFFFFKAEIYTRIVQEYFLTVLADRVIIKPKLAWKRNHAATTSTMAHAQIPLENCALQVQNRTSNNRIWNDWDQFTSLTSTCQRLIAPTDLSQIESRTERYEAQWEDNCFQTDDQQTEISCYCQTCNPVE